MPEQSLVPLTLVLGAEFDSLDTNANSNWTFLALNLPEQEDFKAQQNKKQSTKILYPGT